MCLENASVHMRHDDYMPAGPFEGYAPGRALTQVSRQVRSKFLLVYKRTTTMRVYPEDFNGYIDTWLQDPVRGTLIVGIDSSNKGHQDSALVLDTDDIVTTDIIPLVELRREKDKFNFSISNSNSNLIVCTNMGTDVLNSLIRSPRDVEQHILGVELVSNHWDLEEARFSVTTEFAKRWRMKQGIEEEVSGGGDDDAFEVWSVEISEDLGEVTRVVFVWKG
jgi:hypothetical protein